MGKAKKPCISALCGKENRNMPITTRYDPGQLGMYEDELATLVSLVEEGKCMPTAHDIRDYFIKQHNMTIGRATIRRHIQRLQNGETLWQE